jgi:hypothetical protein
MLLGDAGGNEIRIRCCAASDGERSIIHRALAMVSVYVGLVIKKNLIMMRNGAVLSQKRDSCDHHGNTCSRRRKLLNLSIFIKQKATREEDRR